MVQFKRPPQEVIDAAHAEYRAQRSARQKPAPAPKNVRHLIDVGVNRVFLYRNMVPIVVPPTPTEQGALIFLLVRQLETEEDMAKRISMLRELIALCTSCCRPVGMWGKLKRRLGRWHPFSDISEGELRGVADFLLWCRQSASIRAT